MTDDERYSSMVSHFDAILDLVPYIDRTDPNLTGTPERLAKMYLTIFSGLDPENAPAVTSFPIEGGTPGLVGTGKIFFSSMCAHHFLPFTGHAYIFYLPKNKIVGLSKFTRIVNYFAARPQVQERLAAQIADHVMEVAGCDGCFVLLRATHSCMQCRGVKQERSLMVTPVIRPINDIGVPVGPFADIAVRSEALALLEDNK